MTILKRTRATGIASVCIVALSLIAGGIPLTFAAPSLNWKACPEDLLPDEHVSVQCATTTVPMDYTDPEGKKIEILFSKRSATGHKIGTIFGNPGGPGGDALGLWASSDNNYPDSFYQNFDLVAMQPRGLRGSTPLECDASGYPPVEDEIGDSPEGTPSGVSRPCPAEQLDYARFITTENTARDQDMVRAALGLEKISYVGFSYGTYLGAVYSTLFPERVDKLVLDSTVNPEEIWAQSHARQQEAMQTRQEDMFAWVAEHNEQYGLGSTAQDVYELWTEQLFAQDSGSYANVDPSFSGASSLTATRLASLGVDKAMAESGVVPDEVMGRLGNFARRISIFDPSYGIGDSAIARGTTRALYNNANWPYFAMALKETHENPDSTTYMDSLGSKSMAIASDDEGGRVGIAVTCNENDIPAQPARLPLALAQAYTGASRGEVLSNMLLGLGGACATEPTTTPVKVSGEGLSTMPMIIQSYHDPATASEGAPGMAEATDGQIVWVGGGTHGLFGRGEPILDNAVMEYLYTGNITISEAPEKQISDDELFPELWDD